MAGTAITDLAAVAPTAGDKTLALATGINLVDQIAAINVKLQDAALMLYDLQQLGLAGATNTALAVVSTDLT